MLSLSVSLIQNIKEHLYTSKFYIIWLAVPESERKLEICQNYNKVCSTLTDLLLWFTD